MYVLLNIICRPKYEKNKLKNKRKIRERMKESKREKEIKCWREKER